MGKTQSRVRDLDSLERSRTLDIKGAIRRGSKRSDKIRAIADSYQDEFDLVNDDDMNYDDVIDPGMTCCDYFYQGCDCDTILQEMMME